MSDTIQSLFEKAILNNSYDYEAMHDTLRKTWQSSYSYLLALQNAYVKYEEFHYTSDDETCRDPEHTGHFYLDKYEKVCFKFDYDLIHACNREEFRLSSFYHNEISFQDIVSHPEIFLMVPVILVDNHVIYDYKLEMMQDKTIVKLPFNRSFIIQNARNTTTDNVVYISHQIQVLLVDNIYYRTESVNKSTLFLDDNDHSIKINASDLKISDDLVGLFMVSFNFPKDVRSQLGSFLTSLEYYDENHYISYLSDEMYEKIYSYGLNFDMHVMFFNELHKKIFYDGTDVSISLHGEDNLFVVEQQRLVPFAMPIPVEDFLVIKKPAGEKGFHIIRNRDALQLHYPNIYTIKDKKNTGDMYAIFYFYHYDESIKYTSIMDFYYRFISNKFGIDVEEVFAKINNGTFSYDNFTEDQLESFKNTFEKIVSYDYYRYNYGENDFLNRYQLLDGNSDKTPWEYQESTLKEWINEDPEALRNYVRSQKVGIGDCYHLFTNTIDLESRERNDISEETGVESQVKFNESMYVFAFNNTKEGLNQLDIRVYVDGEFIANVHQERIGFLEYIYIPKSKVTNDSYIEIENFPGYAFDVHLTFDSLDDEKEVTIVEPSENIYPTFADIYINDQSNPTHLYDNDYFDMTTVTKDGEFRVQTIDDNEPVVFTRLKTFKIKPNSEDVLNKEMELKISKCPKGILYKIEKDSYPYLSVVENLFKFNVKYIRVFHNGRLIPSTKYIFYTSYNAPRIQFLEWFKQGDLLYIDITPFRYEEIYRQEELTEGGIINLKGIINKPFDIRYYDVYVNGRRMSLNNVISISAFEIALVNLTSLYNLQIFEKERDWEYFGLDSKSFTYYFSIDDLFQENYVTEEDKQQLIKDIIDAKKDPLLTIRPNTNDEDKYDFDDNRKYVWLPIFYYNELIPKTFVNPDILQFSKTHLEDEYTLIYDEFQKSPVMDSKDDIEIARRLNYPRAIALDPDTIIEGKKRENESTPMYVYSVGHLDDELTEDMLEQNIAISDKPKYE